MYLSDLKIPYFCTCPPYPYKLFPWAQHPNLTANGVMKYLNPSPATAKGHMKRPRQGIQSTQATHIRPIGAFANMHPPIAMIHNPKTNPNVMEYDKQDHPKANHSCFTAFVDKHTGTLYNNLTCAFPFMSVEGNVCFLFVYHHESNAILALPISGFSNEVIFKAYQQVYKMIESNWFVI